jgi:hypothetical protein
MPGEGLFNAARKAPDFIGKPLTAGKERAEVGFLPETEVGKNCASLDEQR